MEAEVKHCKKTNESLTERLQTVPDSTFGRDAALDVPDYRATLAYLLQERFPQGSVPIEAFLSDNTPNPSSFQRAVALEARRRRALYCAA